MSHQLVFAFVLFSAVMAFTPGPNNVMLLSSGVTYGFRRTVPHMVGITFGFAFMVGVVGFGIGAMLLAYPVLQSVLKYAGAAYLVYLAALIAASGSTGQNEDNKRGPMSFWGAAMFQWVNVKAWIIVVGINTAYAGIASYPWNIVLQSAVTFITAAASTATWALFGTALRPFLSSERQVRIFNISMALLLLASLIPVFMEA